MTAVPVDPYQREDQLLAPYAMPSRLSKGRDYPESEDSFRTVFQRDRDRIIHSTAFRRLEYKTQVFVNHEGDHYRTRLTHTLEVSQISRSVARALRLNEDLVEAISLSHDLGHAPFGHAGEEKLDELMQRWGGFNHNRHCLRVVETLEQRYPGFPGLNLSWELREAIVKHCGPENNPDFERFEPTWQPLLEAQLADIGDSLAYDSHDIDDGLRSGYLKVRDFREVELWRTIEDDVRAKHRDLDDRQLIARTVSAVIRAQVLDLVAESSRRLLAAEIQSVDEVRQSERLLIGFSPEMERQKNELQEFLRERLYRHYLTTRMSEKGKRFIESIFNEYRREPTQLPDEYRERVPAQGSDDRERILDVVICDYVAGMTDRFCQQEYMRLFVPFVDGGAS